jgi:peroxiredoxin Q/BCP
LTFSFLVNKDLNARFGPRPDGGKVMRSVLIVLAVAGFAVALGAQTPPVELKVGDPAPDFALQASDGQSYKLSDFKGKQAVVLAWFPKAFTQGCTIECKSLAEHGDMIKKYEAKYFMASVDPIEGEQGNKAFAETHKADFPLLSDPTKKTAEAYGVLNPRGLANRWTFYIGKDGRILAIDKNVKPATSAEDMAAKLGELNVPTAR